MGKTIKAIADELGISKQAVYKRVTGKLNTVCAPHTYMENNVMFLDEEGEAIVKNDFKNKPCATPLFRTEQILMSYGANTSPYPNPTVPYVQHTEQIRNNSDNMPQNPYGALPYPTPNQSIQYVSNTEHIQTTPVSNTEHSGIPIQNTYGTPQQFTPNPYPNPYTEQSVSNPNMDTHTEQISIPDTEQIQPTYGADTEDVNLLRMQLEEIKEKNHETEIELVKANAEKEKYEEIINQLNQRLKDKDSQIMEQRLLIEKTDNERKILTASLFRNNEFLRKLLQLPLAKRIFDWKNIQKRLMTEQDDISNDIIGESDIDVSLFDENISKKD